jgi:hypothetical protein
MAKTAILVDGGLCRKRAELLWRPTTPIDRAYELRAYCRAHINTRDGILTRQLYRVFYYDCPPINKKIFHSLYDRTIDFGKTDLFSWIQALEALLCMPTAVRCSKPLQDS